MERGGRNRIPARPTAPARAARRTARDPRDRGHAPLPSLRSASSLVFALRPTPAKGTVHSLGAAARLALGGDALDNTKRLR